MSQGFEPRFIINTLVNNDSPIEGRKSIYKLIVIQFIKTLQNANQNIVCDRNAWPALRLFDFHEANHINSHECSEKCLTN